MQIEKGTDVPPDAEVQGYSKLHHNLNFWKMVFEEVRLRFFQTVRYQRY